MHQYVVRRRLFTLGALGVAVVLTACGDKRMKELNLGVTRDSAMSVLATNLKGGGHDAWPNVFTREAYIVGGKYYDVLYYTPDNTKLDTAAMTRRRVAAAAAVGAPPVDDSISWNKYTPLVFFENKLIAKGWTSWDSISKSINVPLKKHGSAS